MFFLGDLANFKRGGRKRGSKNKKRKVVAARPIERTEYPSDAEYKRRQDRRDDINNKRKVASTAISGVREARGVINLIRAFT